MYKVCPRKRPVSHWHAILGTPIIWPLNCQTSRTIREKTRWQCIGSRSVICKPIIWIIDLLHSIGGGNGIELFNDRYINNGMLDFLVKEREAGRIRNLGWSFHGDVKVFDYVLDMGVKWDFVQIQLNYLDWKHASGRNVNADYLYGELEKRGIPAVIMEPLLGGRLSNVPDHIVARLKQQGLRIVWLHGLFVSPALRMGS